MEDVDPHFSTRTKARKAALDILFQADLRECPPSDVLAQYRVEGDGPLRPLTVAIVEGVETHREAIDARVDAACAKGWNIQRMPRVDRTLARIAVFEIDHTDTPAAVVLSEAIELASWLSTDESPAFLHGMLASAVRNRTAE
ncbi:transcription antitermination factor NusB [uncultured Tessaracoccus sp.]|uniref:transcription antitermination factor NusB n=1 Tax=uncultured Tessaracoccus sp. TaxID=905023 RepID=UPI0025DBB45F|nr:transcription antitermination factor NusB [uncultured Tessaracoccus sp.]